MPDVCIRPHGQVARLYGAAFVHSVRSFVAPHRTGVGVASFLPAKPFRCCATV